MRNANKVSQSMFISFMFGLNKRNTYSHYNTNNDCYYYVPRHAPSLVMCDCINRRVYIIIVSVCFGLNCDSFTIFNCHSMIHVLTWHQKTYEDHSVQIIQMDLVCFFACNLVLSDTPQLLLCVCPQFSYPLFLWKKQRKKMVNNRFLFLSSVHSIRKL